MIQIGKYNCYILVQYYPNHNIGLQLIDPKEGPYAVATVNIAELPKGYAALDTNNLPEIEDIMFIYGLGEPTGIYLTSGYCEYPVYKLDIKEISKYTN